MNVSLTPGFKTSFLMFIYKFDLTLFSENCNNRMYNTVYTWKNIPPYKKIMFDCSLSTDLFSKLLRSMNILYSSNTPYSFIQLSIKRHEVNNIVYLETMSIYLCSANYSIIQCAVQVFGPISIQWSVLIKANKAICKI